jgi:hypothetical protein
VPADGSRAITSAVLVCLAVPVCSLMFLPLIRSHDFFSHSALCGRFSKRCARGLEPRSLCAGLLSAGARRRPREAGRR